MSSELNNKYISTTNYKIASKYNGFIDQNGNFYIVSSKYKHTPTHEMWATDFLYKNTDYIRNLANPSGSFLYTLSRLRDKQDILIHFYGFIYYSHDDYSDEPIIIYPIYAINDKRVTSEQKKMLYDVLKENHEEDYFKYDFIEYDSEERHERYVDSFINKRLEEEIKK